MECISIFDMLKIGVGPSSSHTFGPWRAARRWIAELKENHQFNEVTSIHVDLFGSLSLTGKGHATDIASLLGLCGYDPQTIDVASISTIIDEIKATKVLLFNRELKIDFDTETHIVFNREFKEFHPNAITFSATLHNKKNVTSTFYSIGGGFVVKEERKREKKKMEAFKGFPLPIQKATDLLDYCKQKNKKISEIVLENERSLYNDQEIDTRISQIWNVMLESMYQGCHTEGTLPGGLNVRRRAFDTHKKLIGATPYKTPTEWVEAIRDTEVKFRQILKWVSCFALAVNEVNASLGRVVTAPTNGSAGVIPAVMMYYMVIENHDANFDDIKQFMLVAGEIGSLFKKGATISAAMGGCQAEIGVSSAMAAGALTELMGGTPEQVVMASEIAMGANPLYRT